MVPNVVVPEEVNVEISEDVVVKEVGVEVVVEDMVVVDQTIMTTVVGMINQILSTVVTQQDIQHMGPTQLLVVDTIITKVKLLLELVMEVTKVAMEAVVMVETMAMVKDGVVTLVTDTNPIRSRFVNLNF